MPDEEASSSPCAQKEVFISYARRTSREPAQALFEALGGQQGVAFLDAEGMTDGEHFPRQLAAAILGAKVFVAFVDDAYFRRWVCLRELRTALAPFEALLTKTGHNTSGLEEALRHIVIAPRKAEEPRYSKASPRLCGRRIGRRRPRPKSSCG